MQLRLPCSHGPWCDQGYPGRVGQSGPPARRVAQRKRTSKEPLIGAGRLAIGCGPPLSERPARPREQSTRAWIQPCSQILRRPRALGPCGDPPGDRLKLGWFHRSTSRHEEHCVPQWEEVDGPGLAGRAEREGERKG